MPTSLILCFLFSMNMATYLFCVGEECDVETYDVTKLSESTLEDMEADTFWCMNKLLDGIQDNYTFAQPGVQTKVSQLKELTKRVDGKKKLQFTYFL